MLTREAVEKQARAFKIKQGMMDEPDETAVATLHLMNAHDLHLHQAQDQTCRGGNDHGIDAWHYDNAAKRKRLTLYQSKLTTAKAMALKGFEDLVNACNWLGEVLKCGALDARPTNVGIYNLARHLDHEGVVDIDCVLISPFDPNELDDAEELAHLRNDLAGSALFSILKERGGKLDMRAEQYRFDGGGIGRPPEYPIDLLEGTSLTINDKVHLDLVLISLHGLVELLRARGTPVFENNVRLYLPTKEARLRVQHPMEETFDQICGGAVPPEVFAYYHVGVTVSAFDFEKRDGQVSLRDPQIVNGCQTVNIADRFLARMEREIKKSAQKAEIAKRIELFKRIPVVAKIIRRAPSALLREIAICNNRQNPIESWQLFANDPVQCELENALRDVGVFYERQKGGFEALKSLKAIQAYPNTNNTHITVVGLGQVVCLCRRELHLAAKPSEIFVDKEQHDRVFSKGVAECPRDIIWAWNAHKAVKRALQNYLVQPTWDNEQTHRIFKKPLVLQSMHLVGMLHLYQKRRELSGGYIHRLNKVAPQLLVDEVESCYRSVVRKTKEFYLAESKNLSVDVSRTKMQGFLVTLCSQLGLDFEGDMPFTDKAQEWGVVEDRDE